MENPISTWLSRNLSGAVRQDRRFPEEAVAEPNKHIRTRDFKNTRTRLNTNKVDWATWLLSDIQDADSDNDLDYKDIEEEEEEAEELSDNDLSELELDHVETVYGLCAEVSQERVLVAYQEQERKMLKDKIGCLEQQLESLQKAAALEMSAREALENSAKEATEQAAEGKKAVEAANIALQGRLHEQGRELRIRAAQLEESREREALLKVAINTPVDMQSWADSSRNAMWGEMCVLVRKVYAYEARGQ